MMWGTTDPLADEVQYFKNRLVEAGVKNTFITYEGMPHAFNAHHVLSQARKETLDTADVLRKMIAASDAESA
jgi:acetyl esterase/lipase